MSKIRGDIPSDNKRLRLNNLKKVANAIEEYNSEIMGLHYSSGFVQPDLTKAAEGNRQDMGKYLKLIFDDLKIKENIIIEKIFTN